MCTQADNTPTRVIRWDKTEMLLGKAPTRPSMTPTCLHGDRACKTCTLHAAYSLSVCLHLSLSPPNRENPKRNATRFATKQNNKKRQVRGMPACTTSARLGVRATLSTIELASHMQNFPHPPNESSRKTKNSLRLTLGGATSFHTLYIRSRAKAKQGTKW